MNRRSFIRAAALSALGIAAFPARPGRAQYPRRRGVATVSIESQGADPTGAVSSLAALVAAYTAAGVGGTVTAGAGTFLFNDAVFTDTYTDNDAVYWEMPGGRIFQGAGMGITEFVFTSSIASIFHAAGIDDFAIYDLTIRQPGVPGISTSSSNAIKLPDSTNFEIARVESIGGYQGIVPIGSRHGIIRQCKVHDTSPVLVNAGIGIHPNNLRFNIAIPGPHFGELRDYTYSDDILVEDCEVYNVDLGVYANDDLTAIGTFPRLRIIRPNVHDLNTAGSGVGILLLGTRDAVVDGEVATRGAYVSGGRTYRCVTGIQTQESLGSVVRGMSVRENRRTGVDLIGSTRPRVEHSLIEDNGREADNTYQGIFLRQAGRPVPTTDAVIESCNVGQTLSGNRQSYGIFAVEGEALRTRRVGGRYYGMPNGQRYFLGSTGIDEPVVIDTPPTGTPIRSR
jgi:hypothetical protein